MKETTESFQIEDPKHKTENHPLVAARKRNRCCCVACSIISILLLTFLIIILILIFTVFKPKDPKTTLISTSIDGIAPRVSIPSIKIELNITLDLQIKVENRNHASFKHDQGKSLVFYKQNQIGDVDVFTGNVPAMGSEIIKCRLVVEAEKFVGSDLSGLISDVLNGEMVLETKTRIPGRVKFLGFIKRRAVAISDCILTIGVPDLKLKKQECRNKTKL